MGREKEKKKRTRKGQVRIDFPFKAVSRSAENESQAAANKRVGVEDGRTVTLCINSGWEARRGEGSSKKTEDQ